MGIDMVNIRNISASDFRTVYIGVIHYRLGYIGIFLEMRSIHFVTFLALLLSLIYTDWVGGFVVRCFLPSYDSWLTGIILNMLLSHMNIGYGIYFGDSRDIIFGKLLGISSADRKWREWIVVMKKIMSFGLLSIDWL